MLKRASSDGTTSSTNTVSPLLLMSLSFLHHGSRAPPAAALHTLEVVTGIRKVYIAVVAVIAFVALVFFGLGISVIW